MMKKIFSFLLMSAMLLAVGSSVVSCSSDDEDDGIINEQRVERYVAGYKWYLDNKKWWQDIVNGEYQQYYDKMYGNR